MNYAVMYQYAVDRDSGQFKAPFNQINNEARVNDKLTFTADQFPPVNAFWSVTMYDGKTHFLIENPINRYLINSPMLPDSS